jgi:hypothetical protein
VSDQEREERSDDVSEEDEMSAESSVPEEADDAETEPEEQPPRYRPLSGY